MAEVEARASLVLDGSLPAFRVGVKKECLLPVVFYARICYYALAIDFEGRG